jgi:PPK2 family polyphosphate:nucleotide phosphotransferase
VLEQLRVKPGFAARIADRDPRDALGLDKSDGAERLQELQARIDTLQYRLFAENTRSVLLVLQGLDASGKDGVVRRVFEGVNPTGIKIVSFRAPVGVEREHDYLWRVHAEMPSRGEVGVFNRSHYEDVVAVRMLDLAPKEIWERRPAHLCAFERMLVDEGTTLVKVFLNVSRDEQATRLRERIDDPEKRWKFSSDDLKVRDRFDDWVQAWEDVITQTSTEHAPWYVVPADRNWVKALAVATLLVDALDRIDPQLPEAEEGLDGLIIE